ncbi:YjcZ family sporulation protein [Heyndrickxia camelliae]|uniref:Sporulation protein YjcZ n=1 Tax=Heyndrickxia camelliae TaxID=1707093 RepID=A0A2N3LK95_9BACI|nr:YjcZ family sporulation protein [Heyndrickxia camelliae]PKR85026.1 sporulation protein YjcZ [Heyndrickxia camelliae]
MGFCCNRGYAYAAPVGYGGNMFVLLVVLFILLIIIGAAWVC